MRKTAYRLGRTNTDTANKTTHILQKLLKPNGIIIGTGEPNRLFFLPFFNMQLINFAKRLGFNAPLPSQDVQENIVEQLQNKGFHLRNFWDVVKTVEYHSPLEQDEKNIVFGKLAIPLSKSIIMLIY